RGIARRVTGSKSTAAKRRISSAARSPDKKRGAVRGPLLFCSGACYRITSGLFLARTPDFFLAAARGFLTTARGFLASARGLLTPAGFLASARGLLAPAGFLATARGLLTPAGFLASARGPLTPARFLATAR